MNKGIDITIRKIDETQRKEYKDISGKVAKQGSSYTLGSLVEVLEKTETAWKDIINKNNIFLVEHIGTSIGTFKLTPSSGREFEHLVNLYGLFVLKEWRNKGVGSSIMTFINEWITTHETIEKVWLFVRADNQQAIQLYESSGRRKVGLLEKEWKVDGEYYDECIYEKVYL